jgi:cytochrome c peroxidase
VKVALVLAVATCAGSSGRVRAPLEPVTSTEQLGKLVFEDPALSSPAGQACQDCHAPHVAFRDPVSDRSTSPGAVPGRFGARNAPTAMYARFVPPLHDSGHGYVGGFCWDGRAGSLEEQAGGPLLNPLEMNNPDKATVVEKVRHSTYAASFRAVFGPDALDDTDKAFANITKAIAAYERTDVFAPFSSKYDRYMAGNATFSDAEKRGLAIFNDPARGNCASCHPAPMFTNYSYANLGIPRYDNNKIYMQPASFNPDGEHFIDHGLMQTTHDPADDGMFRVPTLRNIARTPPYGHNGYFANVPYMLEFLATRDLGAPDVPTCSRATPDAICAWPGPEVAANVDQRVGHLPLDKQDLDDLAAFLSTLTDEHKP